MIPALIYIVAAYTLSRLVGLIVHEIRVEGPEGLSTVVIAGAALAMLVIVLSTVAVVDAAGEMGQETRALEELWR